MPKRDANRSMSLTSQESYSAVIIADMVAEVRTEPEEEFQPSIAKNSPSKASEQTNQAFDPYLYTSPAAVVDVELVETTGQSKRNGATGITKGVILNATQFGHSDKLVPDPLKMDRNVAKVPEVPMGLKYMSVPRKIAFGISFVPSIMFVLCFAVLLPCKEPVPCLREVWSNTLDNTVVTSNLVVFRGSVFYTSSASSSKSIVSGISQESGTVAWTASLKSPARFLHCAFLENNYTESCLVVDNGQVYLFNASNGHLQWKQEKDFSSLAGLPDCDGDGLTEVALALTKGQVMTLRHGAILTPVNLTGCDSVPSGLTPWKRVNGTDLLFTCRQGSEEKLMKLPESRWCSSAKKSTMEDILTFESRDVLEGSVFLPTEDGVVLWVEDDVIMFDLDGEQRWKVSSSPHSSDNRFLLYGKFNDTDTHVALFSSSLRNSLRVTTLSSVNGEVAWSKTELNSEISDVSLIHGKEKDFALVSMRKSKGSLASDALDTMEAVTSTIMSVLTKEDIAFNDSLSSGPSRMTEETAFLEFGDKFLHLIEERELSYAEGQLFRSTVTVVSSDNVGAETLSMIIQRRSTGNSKDTTTQLRRIDVANWDISLTKESQCKWNQ